jgi:hypothetical protein
VRSCAWNTQHSALNVAFQPQAYKTLQQYCYESSAELPHAMNIVLSTPSVNEVLRLQQHEEVHLVITPPSMRHMTCAVLRNSVEFHSMRVMTVRVTGITPLRDRVGRFTHRAVCRVQL